MKCKKFHSISINLKITNEFSCTFRDSNEEKNSIEKNAPKTKAKKLKVNWPFARKQINSIANESHNHSFVYCSLFLTSAIEAWIQKWRFLRHLRWHWTISIIVDSNAPSLKLALILIQLFSFLFVSSWNSLCIWHKMWNDFNKQCMTSSCHSTRNRRWCIYFAQHWICVRVCGNVQRHKLESAYIFYYDFNATRHWSHHEIK